MGEEENKAIARMFFDEVLSRGNLNVIDKLLAENFVDHSPAPGMVGSREGVRQWVALFRAAFPDAQATIEDILADGDKVLVRGSMTGTHQGEFMGIPATGKRVKVTGFNLTRFHEGQSVEHWGLWDFMGGFQQLGVMPPMPGQPPTE